MVVLSRYAHCTLALARPRRAPAEPPSPRKLALFGGRISIRKDDMGCLGWEEFRNLAPDVIFMLDAHRTILILKTTFVMSGTPFVNRTVTGSEVKLENESVRVT